MNNSHNPYSSIYQLRVIDTSPAFQVHYDELDMYWKEVTPFLQKVIDGQEDWSLDSLKAKLSTPPTFDSTPMQLWYHPGKYAGVTQIQRTTKGCRCLIFLCGGEDLPSIVKTYGMIKTWAARHYGTLGPDGKKHIKMLIQGRRGWLKELEGFRVKEYVLEADVEY